MFATAAPPLPPVDNIRWKVEINFYPQSHHFLHYPVAEVQRSALKKKPTVWHRVQRWLAAAVVTVLLEVPRGGAVPGFPHPLVLHTGQEPSLLGVPACDGHVVVVSGYRRAGYLRGRQAPHSCVRKSSHANKVLLISGSVSTTTGPTNPFPVSPCLFRFIWISLLYTIHV